MIADGRCLNRHRAGFPGVPLCTRIGTTATLLDSVGKKTRAVSRSSMTAGLAAAIGACRSAAEEHAIARGEFCQLVIARAVSLHFPPSLSSRHRY